MRKPTVLAVVIIANSLFLFSPIVSVQATTTPLGLPMVGSDWKVENLVSQGNGNFKISASAADTIPTGGVFFPFPNAGPSASHPTYTSEFTIGFPLSLSASNTITATIKIPTECAGISPCLTTMFVGNPDGSACGTVNSVRLFFQSTNTNSFETHYWWSNPTSYTITTGGTITSVTLTAPLNGAGWSDFYGHFGDVAPYSTGFAAAIQNIKTIGLSFGSGCFFANGVGVDSATGVATFQLLEYKIT